MQKLIKVGGLILAAFLLLLVASRTYAQYSPAVLVVDQDVVDGQIVVARAVINGPGWIVIHADNKGAPGPVIGYSPLVAGINADVSVSVDTGRVTDVLYAMLHVDEGTVGTYEFPGADAPLMVDNAPITPAFKVTGTSLSVVGTIMLSAGFKTLTDAIKVAGLEKQLHGSGPFTLFAPTNAAFAALPKGKLDELLADPTALKQLLLYHVVQGKVLEADVKDGQETATLQGAKVKFTVSDSKVMVNDATITAKDIATHNGVIHVIDKVLVLPESAEAAVQAAASTPITVTEAATVTTPIPETETATATQAATETPTTAATDTATATEAATATSAPTDTPTIAATNTATATEAVTETQSVTAAQVTTATDTATATEAPTDTPTSAATNTATATSAPTDTPTTAATDTATATSAPTATPTIAATDTPTEAATATPTIAATDTPTATEAVTETQTVTAAQVTTETQTVTATETTTGTGSTQAAAGKDIVDTAAESGDFTTLLSLAQTAGVVDALKGTGPLTVFAPTDAAFAALPQGTLDTLTAQPDLLKQVLLYHVVDGKIMASQLTDRLLLRTEQGDFSKVAVQAGATRINDANIVTSDIEAANGVIHVIDSVLVPQAVVEALAPKTEASASSALTETNSMTGTATMTGTQAMTGTETMTETAATTSTAIMSPTESMTETQAATSGQDVTTTATSEPTATPAEEVAAATPEQMPETGGSFSSGTTTLPVVVLVIMLLAASAYVTRQRPA